ncbi:hypothetical protein RO3G_05799 [Rhizopus delemar RA 99-880]|uniref:Uncharacterized protein n=1 Tax=Rhizopus delemar (strain RA 99-880 / ATCC MYA-4621 / FGSC 9543 / NRRL 43880) TaxID=246409 RepID=I1BY14_RHIO9|nr:hypothetical protein RO3G_05799 [Rhizopus delemar RA 99-880]|eukprot:EIE81094.1 hypothetical protein RO3G_05799 [Rhizopus delemar RA 99-880]
MRVNSVDEVFICQPEGALQLTGAWNDKQERMKMKMEDGQHWADLVYKNDLVIRLRFDWLVDYEQQRYESLEAIASSTDDGVVMVIRLAPRFDLDQ